jgi:iron complex transport system ATP-binding protein
VIVARALAQQPRLLLLDEPTANLDIQHQLQVLGLVKGLTREGLTAIAAIHDLDLAARFCDRLVLIHEGRAVADGPPWSVLTPENLSTAFGVRAFVAIDPLTEAPSVTVLGPASTATPRSPHAGAHIHVIAGGGRGGRVLHLLHDAGYRLTTGVLSEEDTDRAVARLLDIEAVAVPAFSPIDEPSRSRNRALIESAELVVLCPVPFGWGNVANLEDAGASHRLLLLEDQPIEERDYTDGAARSLYEALSGTATRSTVSAVLDEVETVLASRATAVVL